jgi:hypothetical protein
MAGGAGMALEGVPGELGRGGRCADCHDVSCALRAALAGGGCPGPRAAATSCAPRRFPLGLILRARALRFARYRLPTLAAAAAAAAVVLFGRPLGPGGWAALVLGAAAGLWWSAPRATAPGWGGRAALLAAAAAAGTAPASAAWVPVALAFGLALRREARGPGAALAAAGAAAALLAGAGRGPAAAAGIAAAGALGLLWQAAPRAAGRS